MDKKKFKQLADLFAQFLMEESKEEEHKEGKKEEEKEKEEVVKNPDELEAKEDEEAQEEEYEDFLKQRLSMLVWELINFASELKMDDDWNKISMQFPAFRQKLLDKLAKLVSIIKE